MTGHWHIIRSYESGDETVFHCARFNGETWHFTKVRVLTIWWRTQGSVTDILRKAEERWQEEQGQKP